MKDFKKTTPWYYTDGGETVTPWDYGFTCFTGQAPYFSITGETWKARKNAIVPTPKGIDGIAFGCLHDYFPKDARFLRAAVPFHLYSLGNGPPHYLANAKYRHAQASGELDGTIHDPNREQYAKKTPWELFEGSILWGVLEGDDDHRLRCLKLSGPETLDMLLKDRLAQLDARFLQVMVEIGCDGLHDAALAWHRENG